MKNKIILSFLLCTLLFGGPLSLHAKEAPKAALKKEVTALSKKIEALDNQQKNALADLKKNLDENKAELVALRTELEAVKNQKCTVSGELTGKVDQQQKKLADATEILYILVKYGNNPEGMSVLHYAISQGDANAVNLLIANGAHVNSRDGNLAALTRAASCNQFEITQILLRLGADVHLTVYDDGRWFPYAINYAAEHGSADLVTFLIENGAKINKACPYDDSSYPITPLHTASKIGNYEAIVALVNGGAKIDGNAKNVGLDGWRQGAPLDWAAYNLKYSDNAKNLEIIKFLVEQGTTRRAWFK